MNNRNKTIVRLYTVFVGTAILGFLRKGKCFWTTQGFFDMLPHNGILPVEIDLDNLFSGEVCRQSSLYLISPLHNFRAYLRVEGTVKNIMPVY
jgi:hypothetical protein